MNIKIQRGRDGAYYTFVGMKHRDSVLTIEETRLRALLSIPGALWDIYFKRIPEFDWEEDEE